MAQPICKVCDNGLFITPQLDPCWELLRDVSGVVPLTLALGDWSLYWHIYIVIYNITATGLIGSSGNTADIF
jgi:hypothetical protein